MRRYCMSSINTALVCLLPFLVLLASTLSSAQVDPALENGLKPFGTYNGSNVDFVNTTTGKLHIHIPLLSYPQRGGRLHLNYFIDYDSATYTHDCSIPQHCIYYQTGSATVSVQPDVFPIQHQQEVTQDGQYIGTIVSVIDPEGASHRMGAIPSSTQMRALDASGYLLTFSTGVITDADGNTYSPLVATDTHGNNHITATTGTTGFTDTIGRVIPPPPSPSSSYTGVLYWQVPAEGTNNTVTYTFTYNDGALTSLELPNGTAYTFSYDTHVIQSPYYLTELQQVTLPTGGSISYQYGSLGSGCVAGNYYRTVTKRVVNDGVHQNQWLYTLTENTSMAIQDPMGNTATHTIANFASGGCSLYETGMQQRDAHGNLLKTVTTTYQYLIDPDPPFGTPAGFAFSVVPHQQTTAWLNGPQSTTTTNYLNSFPFCDLAEQSGSGRAWCTSAQGTALYVGNPSSVASQDYCTGSGCSGSTLRTTTITYQAFVNNNYLNNNQLNLKQQVQISSPLGNGNTTSYTYDGVGGSGGSGGYAGDLTQENQGLGVVHSYTYTPFGMVQQDTDALGNPTQYYYDSSNLFLKSVDNALGQYTHYVYDSNTGLLTSATDANNQPTSYGYDDIRRPLSVSYPDGGSISYSYDDTPGSTSVQVKQAITDSQSTVETAKVDGLGRLIQSQLNSDPQGTNYVDITYDGNGRKASVSNPYRDTDPVFTITYNYDALDRLYTDPISHLPAITQPDGSTINYTYLYSSSGVQTNITDEAGNQRTTQANALGWLTDVWEAPNVSGMNYHTQYTYDGLGNLTYVNQPGVNSRSFLFDSLSRLTSASNPETGTITYGYDTTNTLISRKDSRSSPITTTYVPDPLHRLKSKSYSDNEPTIYYCYDNQQSSCGVASVSNGIGRRTGMSDASGSTSWSYDVMGRVAKSTKAVSGYGGTGSIWYDYNLNGSLNSQIFPDGDGVSYTYNSAGRVSAASYDDFGVTLNYFVNPSYTASGAIQGYQSNNFTDALVGSVTNSYNSRLQPSGVSASTAQGTIFNLTYDFHVGNGDNGNLYGITNSLNSCRSQAYTYDQLNRLLTANSTPNGSCPNLWGNSYTYDSRGNLTAKTVTQGNSESFSNSVNANNQLEGWAYDGGGNATNTPGGPYDNIFNADNQWTYQNTYNVSYLYDGDGVRVKSSGGASGSRIYWYDAGGNVVEEDSLSGKGTSEYLYVGHQRIARVYNFGPAYFYYGDHLGTSRVSADEAGNMCYDADYFPWGNEQDIFVNTCPQNYKFSGKEDDPDLGVYYFGARFYQDSMARFYSPDPVNILPQKLVDPQQWDMYSYVRDNPLRFTDPTGQYLCKGSDPECSKIKAGYSAAQIALKAAKAGSTQAKQLKSVLGFLGEPDRANGVVVKFGENKVGVPADTHTETSTDLLGTSHTTTIITFDLQQLDSAVKLNSGHPLEPLDDDIGALMAHEGTHGRDDLARGHDPQSKGEAFATERNAYRNEGYVYDLLGVPSYINPSLTAPGADRGQVVDQLSNASVEAEGW